MVGNENRVSILSLQGRLLQVDIHEAFSDTSLAAEVTFQTEKEEGPVAARHAERQTGLHNVGWPRWNMPTFRTARCQHLMSTCSKWYP